MVPASQRETKSKKRAVIDGARCFFAYYGTDELGAATYDGVVERPNAVDGDTDRVTGLEGEVVCRHDPGAGEQQNAVGEEVIATEVVDELGKGTDDFGRVDRACEGDGAVALNFDGDSEVFGVGHVFCQGNHRPDGAAPAVHFCLWEVERVFALDVTR